MKNVQLKLKLSFLAAFVLLAGVLGASAQNQTTSRYADNDYGVAFQIPKNSSKAASSSKNEVNFIENSELGSTLQFLVYDKLSAEDLSALLASEASKQAVINGFITGVKGGKKETEVEIVEKSDVKIGNLNAYKATVSIIMSGIKLRAATFFVPVPEHKRLYSFSVIGLDSDFDRWYKIAETSINSFEIVKAK
jgi:hypothetical protein